MWYSYDSMRPVTAPPLARGLKSRTSTFITTWTRLVPEGALDLQPPLSSIEASKTVCQNSEKSSGTILSFLHVYTWEGATRMDHTPQSLLYLTWNFMRSIWKLDIMKVGRLTLKLSSWCKSRRIGVERITSAQHEVNQYHLVNCKSLLYSWFHGNCLGFLFLFARTSTLDFNPIFNNSCWIQPSQLELVLLVKRNLLSCVNFNCSKMAVAHSYLPVVICMNLNLLILKLTSNYHFHVQFVK